MPKLKQLPTPNFVNLKNAAELHHNPNNGQVFMAAEDWRKSQGIRPCGSDKVKIELLVIDAQNDFCHPEGTLFVAGRSDPKATSNNGAIEDNKRLAAFIYSNLGVISSITATMDTHFPYQIFFPSFWKDENGQALKPFTFVTTDMIRTGKATVNPAVAHFISHGNMAWLNSYVRHYAESLEKAGKYTLTIWPFHCLLGTAGHALNGLISEAMLFHSFVRGDPGWRETKGGNYLTENYSVLSPEVLVAHDSQPIAQRNVAFIKRLMSNDHVIVAGQAASHCVKSSIDDLLDAITQQDPELAKKVTILTDCTSSVTVPDGKGGYALDCTPDAEKAFKKFADAGMHLAKSSDPIESYPGVKL